MSFKKITAIVRNDCVEKVEHKLQALLVPGISVTRVKGYGEYINYFTEDELVCHAKIEAFVEEKQTEEIVQAIMSMAHSGLCGDGVVAVTPVDDLFRIRTMSKAVQEEP